MLQTAIAFCELKEGKKEFEEWKKNQVLESAKEQSKFGNKLRDGYRAPKAGFHETSVRNRVPHDGKSAYYKCRRGLYLDGFRYRLIHNSMI